MDYSQRIIPRALKRGDQVAIIAPSSPGDQVKVGRAYKGIEALGLKPKFYPSCFAHHGHLAGVDALRLNDLHDAFSDPEIKGIICLKGGSGATRLLDRIDYDLIRRNPKVFVGYSDVTALHLAIGKMTGLVTFHGPMALSDMYRYSEDGMNVVLEAYSMNAYTQALFQTEALGLVANPEHRPIGALVGGQAQGLLVGGNLSLLVATLGSPYEIDTLGKILFIEDTHEATYAVDRMLCALSMAGKFRDCSGIILGTWTDCHPQEKNTYAGQDLSLETIFEEVVLPWQKPTLMNVYLGHNTPQMTLPLGVSAHIDGDRKELRLLESGVKGDVR